MSLEYPVRLMIGNTTSIAEESDKEEEDLFVDAVEIDIVQTEDANLLVDKFKYKLPKDFGEVLESTEMIQRFKACDEELQSMKENKMDFSEVVALAGDVLDKPADSVEKLEEVMKNILATSELKPEAALGFKMILMIKLILVDRPIDKWKFEQKIGNPEKEWIIAEICNQQKDVHKKAKAKAEKDWKSNKMYEGLC
ncbi:hypothetical protein CANARDRAFT_30823 [[Candida] arabinofermentans NRRL YB-2248]|uniref:Uncharacterized protein n=1 Tax=[Candida] arabinofermentans NRRL YB-2248 TaxID=983967 RepID=A0A1E4SSU6_9ASCO|nr:hypothetical protein CANARDRAFT_30823 [[Candida] arabinofermentans NRRL YB-2248]